MEKLWFIIIKWPVFAALLIWASIVGDYELVCIAVSITVCLHLLNSDLKQYQRELDQQYKDHVTAEIAKSTVEHSETIN